MRSQQGGTLLSLVAALAILGLLWHYGWPGAGLSGAGQAAQLKRLQPGLNAQLMTLVSQARAEAGLARIEDRVATLSTSLGPWQLVASWPKNRSGDRQRHYLLELLNPGWAAEPTEHSSLQRRAQYGPYHSLETAQWSRIGFGDLEHGNCFLEYRPGEGFQPHLTECR